MYIFIYSFFRFSSYTVLSRIPCIILLLLLLGCAQLFGTSWTVACKAPLSSTSPRVCLDSYPLSWWCYLTISSSTALFSFCLQSFPASGSFLMSQVFKSCGQRIEASSNKSSSAYSGLISFEIDWLDLLAVQRTVKSLPQQNKKPSIIWCQPSLWSNSHIHTWLLEKS